MITLRYFAWVRERIGRSEEIIDVPETVETVAQLIAWLTKRSPAYAAAFEKPDVIRAAIDQKQVKADATLAGAREIAFFPPMTGG